VRLGALEDFLGHLGLSRWSFEECPGGARRIVS
jgi:hypothetical protein